MKKKWLLPAAAALCALSLIFMALALAFHQKQQTTTFTPPSFDPAAVAGTPTVDASLGWSEIYQEGMAFKASVCGNVITDGSSAVVYFTNAEGFDVWLKLRILNEDGEILGETGLLKPGEYVKSVALTADVTDGETIKLKIMAYEPDTYYSAGSVSLKTTISKGELP
ncbi:MAG: hypothetical protein Q4F41_16590 [Eubacteriales bacterium]|nr:hypothetical protein [Eubacteriales bacterium]